jgi:tetratricopeptide (TPR) repeat protein
VNDITQKTHNRPFEAFVLIFLTLGIIVIAILYVRERLKYKRENSSTAFNNNRQRRRGGMANISHASSQNISDAGNENKPYKKRIALYKNRDKLLLERIFLHYSHFRYDDAVRYADDFRTRYPRSKYLIKVMCYQGMAFLKKGKRGYNREYFLEADKILRYAVKLYLERGGLKPDEFSYFVIGVAEANRSLNFSNAHIEVLLKKALLDAGDNIRSSLYVQLGYIEFFKENYNQALSYFLNSSGELSRLGTARVYVKTGKFERAFEIYDEFLRYNSNSIYYDDVKKTFIKLSFYYGKRAFAEEDYVTAYKYLKRLVSYYPHNMMASEATYLIGEAFFAKKSYDIARKYYKRLLGDSGSKYTEASFFKIGLSYYEEHKKEDALKYFNKLLQLYPGSNFSRDALKYKELILNDSRNRSGGRASMLGSAESDELGFEGTNTARAQEEASTSGRNSSRVIEEDNIARQRSRQRLPGS